MDFALLLLAATLGLGALLSWLLLRPTGTDDTGAYETHEEYFGAVLGEQSMSAFSGEGPGYQWKQTDAEVELTIPVAATTRAKDVRCQITPTTIALVCAGDDVALQATLCMRAQAPVRVCAELNY